MDSGWVRGTYDSETNYSTNGATFYGGIVVSLLFFFGKNLHICDCGIACDDSRGKVGGLWMVNRQDRRIDDVDFTLEESMLTRFMFVECPSEFCINTVA